MRTGRAVAKCFSQCGWAMPEIEEFQRLVNVQKQLTPRATA